MPRLHWAGVVTVAIVLTSVLAVSVPGLAAPLNPTTGRPSAVPTCVGSDWPTYLDNNARDAATAGTGPLTVNSAPNLVQLWNLTTGGPVYANPTIDHGVVYVGSWSGREYALNAKTGKVIWNVSLGTSTSNGLTKGVTSSATINDSVIYVGGGNSFFYALKASNGHTIWKVNTGNTSDGYYNWASPLLADGFVYIGIAGENLAVPGGLLQVSLSTHQKTAFFNTTNGSKGAGVWTSPSYNPASNLVFVTTADPAPPNSTWGESILALNATTLTRSGNWTIPPSEQSPDGDFGGTPLLFTTASHQSYVVASGKNGITYAWNQSNLDAGPIWSYRTAAPSLLTGSPNLGLVSYSGGKIFVGTATTNLSGTAFNGSVQALNATTGAVLWTHGFPGAVLDAPVFVNGLVLAGDTGSATAGSSFYVLNAANGHTLFQFHVKGTDKYWGTPAVSHGEIVVGSYRGIVYAFGLKSCSPLGPTLPLGPDPSSATVLSPSMRLVRSSSDDARA
jgi:outer membrane protein assembly factor BamB